MAVGTVTALLALGTAASVAGAAVSGYGNMQQIAAQKDSERIRRNSMVIDSQRKRREIIRQAQITRHQNIAQANAQGASGEGSSVLPGNLGGVAGQTISNLRGVNTAEVIGGMMFDSNSRVSDAGMISAVGGTISDIGSGLRSLGGSFASSAEAYGRVSEVGGTVGQTSGATYSSDPWAGIR